MRLFAVAVISFFLLATHSISSQDKTKPEKPQGESRSQPSAPQPPSSIVQQNIGTPDGTNSSRTTQQETKPEARPFMTHGEYVISFITTVYVIIAFFTFMAIRRQAHIAQQGADALIASERAWVTVTVDWSQGHEGIFHMGPTPDREKSEHVEANISCKNDGRTPAWIIEVRACLKIFDSRPAKPPLEYTEAIKHGIVSLGAGQEKSCDASLSCEGRQTLENHVIIYGVVRYRGISNVVGESLFAYSIVIGGHTPIPIDDAEWNKNT
jgi:hypothetical protein